MSEHKPFFSIVVATYNRADLIGDTISCFFKQTFTDFELIIVDDGSTDDTEERMKQWMLQDSRVRYYKKKNGERGAARNLGVRHASGQYVTFIDSDDEAYPHALQTAYDQLTANPRPPCLALRYEVRDKTTMKETVPPPQIDGLVANESLKRSNVLGCIGVFLKSEIARSLPFEEDRQFAGTEDWLLWLKIGARYPILYNNKICFCIYQHDDRSVMNFSEENLRYRAEELKKSLLNDEASLKVYGKRVINCIYAHMLTYGSLHLAMSKKKGQAIHYLLKGIRTNIHELFTRRTLGIFKNLLLR